LQNLALGLKNRHYVPEILGRRNKYGVADVPVWLEVGIASLCFLFIGTSEETYLSVYAAGVFILLSMTGWAATKRLWRELRQEFVLSHAITLVGTIIAAFLTTGATLIIFTERFTEGAWTYFVFIPVLYAIFTYYRNKLGDPTPLKEQLGRLEGAMWSVKAVPPGGSETMVTPLPQVEAVWEGDPARVARWKQEAAPLKHILVPLGGTSYAEQALDVAIQMARRFGGHITVVTVLRTRDPHPSDPQAQAALEIARHGKETYLREVAERARAQGVDVNYEVGVGPIADVLNEMVKRLEIDLLVMTTHSKSAFQRWLMGSKASKILQLVNVPVLVFRPQQNTNTRHLDFRRLLVPLDGSDLAERILPFARTLVEAFQGEVILLGVPEIPDPALYGTMADIVAQLRAKAEAKTRAYLSAVAEALRETGLKVEVVVAGTEPPRSILAVGDERNVDLIMLTSHGQGGQDATLLGSTAERVVHHSQRPVFLAPIAEKRP